MTIHAIGDSHSYFFTGRDLVRGKTWWKHKPDDRIPGYKSYSIGPATAYKFGEKHLPKVQQLIRDAQIPASDPILLVFGEIDCRLHLGLQAEKKEVHVWDIVNETMNKYIDGVNELRKMHEVIMWGVHPPLPDCSEDDDNVFGNKTFRFNVTRIWNQALMERCEVHHLPYASIFWDLARKDDMGLDKIHLNQNAMQYARNELYPWEEV